MIIKPLIYKIGCSACGVLVTLPIDIIQTGVISNRTIFINHDEIRLCFMMIIMFALQNEIYNRTSCINSQLIRGLISGIAASPVYCYVHRVRYENRLKIDIQNKNILYLLLTIRSIIFYMILYSNLYNLNNILTLLYATSIANTVTFPFKIISFKTIYPNIILYNIRVIKLYIIEMFKNILGDSVSLCLIYNKFLNKLIFTPLEI